MAGLDFAALAPPGRPYLVLNMVATADGRVTIGGRSGPIGGEADRRLFHRLRTRTDAVMAGAGTVRAERYGRIVRDPDLRAARAAAGLAPDPLAIVVSGRLDLPADLPLLAAGEQEVVVLTASPDEVTGARARVSYLRGPEPRLRLAPLLGRLREERGVRSILCEGGPALNGALLAEGLVDELFLSLAPKLAGDAGERAVVEGPGPAEPLGLALVSVLRAPDGELFLRYRVRGRAG